ncbi:MAG TPA: M1 family metallopeptidase [Candidatus Saccharimonadales bacterium]|nr:M1 family metallopeptidase [Candidatus Saccharimonadales bacterium]
MGKKVARLYEQFQPENYQLHLVPDRGNMTFSGTVTIRGKKVGRPSERLTFHQQDLKVISAKVVKHDKKGDQELTVVRINNHDSFTEVRVHTADKVFPGSYSVTLGFEGKITKPMHGIYPCNFKHDGKDKVLIATQFESHHAREAFPCIDEPEAKATFDLTLTTPSGETVIANTPVKKQEAKNKSQVTTFETTPRMSTYLLAFAYGELGYKEAKTKDGVLVRTYATPGQVELTKHGLDVAVRSLEFFSDYFGVPYPLPKLDMIALPDFSSGAMENWGLVTYRETTMLADEKTSSIESKQLVALVIAHELSHQWFGNLVTMKWWDDLWLNESFANLMEYRCVDALYPEWNIWEQFVASEEASAKRRDSLRDVQPIRTGVNHPDEISTLFDPSIVYAKGGSVLYMLLNFIGEKSFRTGLKAYFQKHAYGNTQATDLWDALGAASSQDITDFMAGWLNRPGYPLVSVDWVPGSKTVGLKQRRFLSDAGESEDANEPWQVPLSSTYEANPALLKSLSLQATVNPNASEPFLLNHDGHSYFLARYANAEHLKVIAHAIKQGKVSPTDRLILLDSYNLLQRSEAASTVELLELLQGYEGENNESVWGAMALAIAEARRLVENDPSEDKLDALIAKLTMPLVTKLGWDDAPNDTAQTLRLRGLVLSMAAGAKVQSVLDEGLKRFATFSKPSDLSPTIRGVVFFIGGRYGSDADFQKLLKQHEENTNADERDELASGLTSTKKQEHYSQLLAMLTGDEIRRQDLMHWWVWLLRNRYSKQAAWEWLVDKWGWIEKEFAGDKSYGFYARYAGSIYSREEELKKFTDFFTPKKDVIALARDITLGEQEITSRVAWRKRNEQAVKDWLSKL